MGTGGTRGWQSASVRGLTLLEVLAATAIVLATCVAVTSVVVTAARAGGDARQAAAADEALLAEAARLRALPLFTSLPGDWPERRDAGSASAVGELFPHADAALNAGQACFLPSGARQGAFETVTEVGGLSVRRTAWFARCAWSGWATAPIAELAGWTAWGDTPVPGEGLIVRLEAAVSRREVRSVVILLTSAGPSGALSP